MAENSTTVKIGENSPEYVAYRLMWDVLGRDDDLPGDGKPRRDFILDAYAECLTTVRNPKGRLARRDGA